MPASLPSTPLAFIGRLVGIRHGATTVRYTALISYSSLTLLLAIAAIAVLSQVQGTTAVPPGATAEVSG
jgi:hypothetical protein